MYLRRSFIVGRITVNKNPMRKDHITEIVTNHQGEMTIDEKETMHIIYPAVDPLPEDYAWPMFRRDMQDMFS
ncbi:hypothetical protein pipiens_010684 [Culex pipiens pipiens]|uniref:Uncharacterized protein n=1 Tax=Culex pipiens pipiens TaxID=38569 RepID=A0ABD1D975_CULPP